MGGIQKTNILSLLDNIVAYKIFANDCFLWPQNKKTGVLFWCCQDQPMDGQIYWKDLGIEKESLLAGKMNCLCQAFFFKEIILSEVSVCLSHYFSCCKEWKKDICRKKLFRCNWIISRWLRILLLPTSTHTPKPEWYNFIQNTHEQHVVILKPQRHYILPMLSLLPTLLSSFSVPHGLRRMVHLGKESNFTKFEKYLALMNLDVNG